MLSRVFILLSLTDLENSTIYAILGAEFIIDSRSCHQIISLFKRLAQLLLMRKEKVKPKWKQFNRSLFSAYYEPNALILGNAGNSYRSFVAIDNVRDVVSNTMQMNGIDLGILLKTWLTLWIFFRTDIFPEFCKLLKTCWSWIRT